jgi:hypothetical protein
MQHRVILVDEYDQINEDILPFFSLPAVEFRQRVDSLASSSSTVPLLNSSSLFTLLLKHGVLSVQGVNKDLGRVEDTIDLIGEILTEMDDMKLTFSAHDGSHVVVTGEAKEAHIDAVLDGRGNSIKFEIVWLNDIDRVYDRIVMEEEEYLRMHEDPIVLPWQAACSPNSTARNSLNDQLIILPKTYRDRLSYISTDHQSAMDFCESPSIQFEHGYLAW